MTDEVKSMGEMETLETVGGEAPSREVLSLGEQETQKEGWGILEEWGGKRWKAGEEILGRYVVEMELGQGGMGVVYACLDKVGGVRVAVKALPPELSHNSVEMEEVRDNFELVYKLNHPNIASVKTLERDGKGEYFLVMDVAEGESLRRWMRRKRRSEKSGARREGGGLPLAEVLPILRQVAAALDYAHAKKVVHRDVKPGNVMIDPSGEVKVLDFGLAAQIRTSLSRASQAYRGTSGTGPYMAPEQWMGKPQDGKADQYALGVMAYEMLAGRLPFENSELTVLREAVLRGEADAVPGLPRGAMGALRRAMAKRKEERFGSCGEFVAALGKGSGQGSAKGKILMGWVAALALLGAGVWWGSKQAVRPEGPASQEAAEETAGEPPAFPEETRQDAAFPEDPVEPPALPEEAAQGEEKVLEDTPPEPTPEEQEAAWRAEQNAIRAAARRLDNLQWTAGQMAKRLEEFEQEPLGFTAHLEKARKAAGFIAGAKAPESAAAVSNTLDRILRANSVLTEELGWLNQNRASRDAAMAAEREMAETLDAGLAEYQANRAATAKYSQGRAARKAGNDALVSGDFQKALDNLAEAKTFLVEALTDARAFRAKSLVDDARSFRDAKRWEKCLAAAQGALAAVPGHEEAAALAKEADLNLVPSIQLTATLNGRPVKANVTCAGQFWGTTPLSKPLDAGGDYELSVECAAGLKRFAGYTTVKAKAKGVTSVSVALRERNPEPGEERALALPGNVPMSMVWCPAGTFTMGSPSWEAGRGDDETQHLVRLTEGFWMAKHEVTQKQWKSVMGNNPSRWKGDDLPVEQVSWDDCEEFCRKCREAGVDLRLPTEAEWEYACRAGSVTVYGRGNEMNLYLANFDGASWNGESMEKTTPVGSYGGNAWGLCDMHGNVSEWCADWYKRDWGTAEATNPKGPEAGTTRVVRGGSWGSSAWNCRSAARSSFDPAFKSIICGFRPCRPAGRK